MLINASLTRPCVQKLQALAHGRISNKLKAAVLSPFAGIALPFGDACMHSALAVVKTPFLVAPLSIGRLAGKGFVSSLDRRSPRQALLSQMAFHVVRSLASLTLLAVSALAIPTIPFLVIMPRIVSKTHDRLGLNRLFRTRIPPKPCPVKPAAIVKAVTPMIVRQAPQIQPTPILVPRAQSVEPAHSHVVQQQNPIVPIPAVATSKAILPPSVSQPLPAPIASAKPEQVSAPLVSDLAPKKRIEGKKRVGLPPEPTSHTSKSEYQQDADRIARLCKNALKKAPKPSDPAPMAPVAAPIAPVAVPAATAVITTPASTATSPLSGSQIIAAILAEPHKDKDSEKNADVTPRMAQDASGSSSTHASEPDSTATQHQLEKLTRHFKRVKAKPSAVNSTEVTPKTSPRSSKNESPPANENQLNKLLGQFARAKKPKPPVRDTAADVVSAASSTEVTPKTSPTKSSTNDSPLHADNQHQVDKLLGQFARAKKPKPPVSVPAIDIVPAATSMEKIPGALQPNLSAEEESLKTGNKVAKLFEKALRKPRAIDENAKPAGNIQQG